MKTYSTVFFFAASGSSFSGMPRLLPLWLCDVPTVPKILRPYSISLSAAKKNLFHLTVFPAGLSRYPTGYILFPHSPTLPPPPQATFRTHFCSHPLPHLGPQIPLPDRHIAHHSPLITRPAALQNFLQLLISYSPYGVHIFLFNPTTLLPAFITAQKYVIIPLL